MVQDGSQCYTCAVNGTLLRYIGVALLVCGTFGGAAAETIGGSARQADGDTLDIGGQKIRLLHIDAPESDQLCNDSRGRAYLCGKEATDQLRRLINGQRVTCTGVEYDRYDRLLAVCHTAKVDLNGEMVRRGWAVRYDPENSDYLAEELEAAKGGRGLWQGDFVRPKDHRAARWQSAQQDAPDGCPIKGNISDRGRIYHTPWSRHYKRTKINTARGERWFCSEAEALQAGWRAPLR